MNRLTNPDTLKVAYDTWELCGLDHVCKRDCWKPEPCKIPAMIRKLAAYEDAEEAGTLARLPSKVGDTVYQIGTDNNSVRIFHNVIKAILYDTDNICFDETAIGKSIFLTREEAEKACSRAGALRDEKITDSINYLLLLKTAVYEEKGENNGK